MELLPEDWHAMMGRGNLDGCNLCIQPAQSSLQNERRTQAISPQHCTGRIGDLSKLVRAVEDALTGVVYDDDAQIVHLTSQRRYVSLEITNIPVPSSPSPPFPNLGDVITTDDVSQKGSGSYKADYVNWCRTMHLLHEHAPGWQFALASAPGGGHVWKAPNGSGYVVGYFISSEGKTTPHFPQAIMDNRNNAVAFDKISARDLTDSHRRCLCTASAAAFGLAWQLWAREEVENPHRRKNPSRQDL